VTSRESERRWTGPLARDDLPILKDPEPVVALETLDTSSINFKVQFWFSTDAGMSWMSLRGRRTREISLSGGGWRKRFSPKAKLPLRT